MFWNEDRKNCEGDVVWDFFKCTTGRTGHCQDLGVMLKSKYNTGDICVQGHQWGYGRAFPLLQKCFIVYMQNLACWVEFPGYGITFNMSIGKIRHCQDLGGQAGIQAQHKWYFSSTATNEGTEEPSHCYRSMLWYVWSNKLGWSPGVWYHLQYEHWQGQTYPRFGGSG